MHPHKRCALGITLAARSSPLTPTPLQPFVFPLSPSRGEICRHEYEICRNEYERRATMCCSSCERRGLDMFGLHIFSAYINAMHIENLFFFFENSMEPPRYVFILVSPNLLNGYPETKVPEKANRGS